MYLQPVSLRAPRRWLGSCVGRVFVRFIHAREENVPTSERRRKLHRDLRCFRSPGEDPKKLTADDSRFVQLPVRPAECVSRTGRTAERRKQMQMARSSDELLQSLQTAILEECIDPSVFGAAFQRCGQGRWWDCIAEVRALQKRSGLTLFPIQRNIYITALTRAVRGAHGFGDVPERQKQLLTLAVEVWTEVAPASDPDTFNSGISSLLRLCAAASDERALQWANELWCWAVRQGFPVHSTTFTNFCLVLAANHQNEAVDSLILRSRGHWEPNVVLLGALVNVAAENRDWQRAEAVWKMLVSDFSIQPSGIAYAARAKAHLLCGRPVAAAQVVVELTQRGLPMDPTNAECSVQASLIVFHSSLAVADAQLLKEAISRADAVMHEASKWQQNTFKEMTRASQRLQQSSMDVCLRDILIEWKAKHSEMIKWPNHRAGINYLHNHR